MPDLPALFRQYPFDCKSGLKVNDNESVIFKEMLADLLYYVSTFSALIPLLTGLAFLSKLESNSRLLLILLALASFSQLYACFGSNTSGKWMTFNMYSITDAIIWSLIFLRNSNKLLTRYAISTVLTAQIIIYFELTRRNGFSGRFFYEFVCLNSFLQLLWVLNFFYEKYKSAVIHALEKEPLFWFCLGLLVYCPTSYFLFVYYKVVRPGYSEYGNLWSIHSLLNTFMYVTFTMGMYVNIKRTSKA